MSQELGSPPSSPVRWVIRLKNGPVKEGFGQTAFVACASIGVLLSEVASILPDAEGG